MKKRLDGGLRFYLLLVLPIALLYVVFFLIPIIESMFFSFTNFNGLSLKVKNVGLKNYRVAIADKFFLRSMVNSLLIAFGVTLLQNSLALLFAVAMNRKFAARGVVRTLIFSPCMIAPIVVAYIWQFIFSKEGLVNIILHTERSWLADVNFAIFGVIIAHTWIWMGYAATIYLANLQSISSDLIEAASIDGCRGFTMFRKITFPLLAPSFTINVTLTITGTLKIFDLVYAMTNGGPKGSTETMGTYMVKQMNANLSGYASALSILMMVVILVFGSVITTRLKKREEILI